MDAGKKLDELVAEKVMQGEGKPGQSYSTDLTAAWAAVDKICEEGYRLQLEGSRIWQARFYKSVAHTLETRAYAATAGTPEAAICLAALAVRGVSSA